MGTDPGGEGADGLSDAARVLTDGVLAHFGIPGMRWGVRRSKEDIASAREVTAVVKDGKGVVKTSGGKERPASTDAIVAKSHRQVAKASTVDALSNKELQELVTRMNLEQQYARLAGPQNRGVLSRGAAFLTKQLSEDAVNKPITSLLQETAGDSASSAFGKVTLGAKVLSPILNKK